MKDDEDEEDDLTAKLEREKNKDKVQEKVKIRVYQKAPQTPPERGVTENWRCNLRCGTHLDKEDQLIQNLDIQEKDSLDNQIRVVNCQE